MKKAYKVLVRELEGKDLSIHGQILLKTDLKETGMEGGEELASFGLEHKPSGRLL
jgi:hypothetical protein